MVKENIDIRNIKSNFEIVDCLIAKTYGDLPEELIFLYDNLPDNQFYNYLRVISVPYLFHTFEKNINSNEKPISWFTNALTELKELILSLSELTEFEKVYNVAFENKSVNFFENEVKSHTGQHYGNLFKEFDQYSFFNEAKTLLKIRLDRNNIDIPNLNQCKVLDQGCGGGRYTTAWKLLGAKEVIGIDFSEIGLQDAKNRVELANINDITFVKGSVLEMPFDNNTFDIVYSNGVLHHTEDWKKGISEQMRVMKSGGIGWQYLIENPGGIFWDKIEILRAILKNVNKSFAQNVLKSLNIPSNRVFYMLDHVMVPINTRVTAEELENELVKNGAISLRRLDRGADFDRVEAIYNKIPFAKEKFGVGEHRYIFNKI